MSVNASPTYGLNNTFALISQYYDWNIAECMSTGEAGNGLTAGYVSTAGKWYADWTSGDENCKNDNNAPQYMKVNADLWMYDNQDDCCNRFFLYSVSECLGRSAVASNKYFPDWSSANDGCQQDTVDNPAPQYMQESSVWLFDTLDACCEAHFSYEEASCKGQSSSTSSGSAKWYVDWSEEKCYKDCETGTDCGGLAGYGDELFDSQKKCCSSKVSYDFRKCMDI